MTLRALDELLDDADKGDHLSIPIKLELTRSTARLS
jgi:hypothetical protein